MWLCNDFLDLAAQTGSKTYINDARRIADFLINNAYTGIDPQILTAYGFSVPEGQTIGAFWWDYRREALHVCANAPACQCLARLYTLTGDEVYLRYAQNCFNFITFLVNGDGVFHDLMAIYKDDDGRVSGVMGLSDEIYSYNSGASISAAFELYRAGGDDACLQYAKKRKVQSSKQTELWCGRRRRRRDATQLTALRA